MNVVTTCEELAFPAPANQPHFRELDRLAQRKKVSVLATGVNPGYAMDALALMLTAPCARVNRVAVTRVVDAGTRRLPLQRKVGAGLNLSQFRRAVTEGTVRHVGLPESVYMIAHGLGWKLDRVDETPGARHRAPRPRHRVPAHPRGSGGGDQAVGPRLPQRRARDQPRPPDVRGRGVAARPRAGGRRSARSTATIAGGVAGDIATAAIAVNAIPKVMAARAGRRSP